MSKVPSYPSPYPRLSCASVPVVREVVAVDEWGQQRKMYIPTERALTVYVDKRELVTLMTLGAHPEWLVLGYLRNQRLVESLDEIESITVDWDVGAAAVKTRHGISDIEKRTEKRVVTTGCGQGSLFGDVLDALDGIQLPAAHVTQTQLEEITDSIRLQDSIYKKAGSVHGCVLFSTDDLHAEKLIFVEDVGRHNAIDTIAGWMWLNDVPTSQGNLVFYTTGRLTSEMIMKSAQMGIAIVVSRSGMTEMGLQLAMQLKICAIGRATHKRFLCFSAPERVKWETLVV